jgi:trans-aconitate 2-methyltransferase
MPTDWSAKLYTAFENERTRPVRDLVAALPTADVKTAVDLGCGPANSTEVLAARFPGATVTGLDSSPDMIETARQRLPSLHFEVADISTWQPPTGFDVILANAALQWVPDHETLYPRLVSHLNEGGSLAVQTPDNLEKPAHALIRETAKEEPWANRVADARHPPRHSARFYYELLKPLCRHVDVWRTTYFHPLAGGPQAVVDWFRSTALRPYVNPLGEEEREAFLASYLAKVTKAYPTLADGSVLLPFPRLFIVATR